MSRHRSIGEVLHVLETEFPDVTISKIRFLESQGLLSPERTPSGYRKFFDDDVERLRWVLVQQRDNFLPLRVIKQRLDSNDWGPVDEENPGDQTPVDEAPASAANDTDAPNAADFTVRARPLDRGPTDRIFSLQELSDASGLETSVLRELNKYGLLEALPSDPGSFDGDALIIAKAAAGFMRHGLELRHLKAWRVAAEREAGTMEQLAIPVTRKRNAVAKGQAVDLANELVTLGAALREAIIRRYLRASLGID